MKKRTPKQVEDDLKNGLIYIVYFYLFTGRFKKRIDTYIRKNRWVIRSHFHLTKTIDIYYLFVSFLDGDPKKTVVDYLIKNKQEVFHYDEFSQYNNYTFEFKYEYWKQNLSIGWQIEKDDRRSFIEFLKQCAKKEKDISDLKNLFERCALIKYQRSIEWEFYNEDDVLDYLVDNSTKEETDKFDDDLLELSDYFLFYNLCTIKFSDETIETYKNFFIFELNRKYDYSQWEAKEIWKQERLECRENEIHKIWIAYLYKHYEDFPFIYKIKSCFRNSNNVYEFIKECLDIFKLFDNFSKLSILNSLKETGLSKSKMDLVFWYPGKN